MLHDHLPLAEGTLIHLEEALSCEDHLNLVLVMSLHLVLHFSHASQKLGEHFEPHLFEHDFRRHDLRMLRAVSVAFDLLLNQIHDRDNDDRLSLLALELLALVLGLAVNLASELGQDLAKGYHCEDAIYIIGIV